jgi:23S rRNA pseudouridine1911/1915/1917 synthase
MQDKVKIIFEDENILAVDKPSGLVVHADGRTQEESLTGWLGKYFSQRPQQENIGNPHTLDSGRYAARWGIVNRLDRDTSGIVLIAKDDKTFFDLQKQFMDRSVVKEYLAKVHGKVLIQTPGGMYKISEPISRHKKDPRIWVCGSGVGERATKRDAETDFSVLSVGEKYSQLRLIPKTGRTHQLRLHCRFLGHPIVGDKKYGVNGIANEHGVEQIKNILDNMSQADLELDKDSRLMLHAKSLEFTHPKTGKILKIEALD